MGITNASARFLIQARRRGVSFESVLTVGRQWSACSPRRLASYLRESGVWPEGLAYDDFAAEIDAAPWRFEALLRHLGARRVDSCDVSGYEGATILHDMNRPVPPELHARFDLVVDAGTLEHVFNFPVAVRNCMEMVKEGGYLAVITPANNYFGHGFYQFSPELFWRVLSPENGFRVERMVALHDDSGSSRLLGVPYAFPITGPWYEVHDPARVGGRVTLLSDRPVTLMVLARRTSVRPIFARTPQQSDYVPQWRQGAPRREARSAAHDRLFGWMQGRLPAWMLHRVIPAAVRLLDPRRGARWRRLHSFRNRRFFTPDGGP
jgi:hypothetical protein